MNMITPILSVKLFYCMQNFRLLSPLRVITNSINNIGMKNLYTSETKVGNSFRTTIRIALVMVGLVVGMANGAIGHETHSYMVGIRVL